MKPLIYICMLIDAGTVLFLFFSLFNSEQDSAGKGMVFLPIILLIGCIAGSWLLMNNGHTGWALFVGGFPVIIIGYLLFISVT